MTTQTTTQDASAPVNPTSINLRCRYGIRYHYDGVTPESMVLNGLMTAADFSDGKVKGGSKNTPYRWHRCKNGAVNVDVDADFVLSKDICFKRFLGNLLSDTRLSLVKWEPSHD